MMRYYWNLARLVKVGFSTFDGFGHERKLGDAENFAFNIFDALFPHGSRCRIVEDFKA